VPQFLAAGGFASIEELQRVPGMTPDIYHRVEPALTLWQAGGSPNLAHAAPLVVAVVGGVSIEEASAFVEARGNAAGPIRELPPLPGGLRVGASLTASDVLSISSKATLADGVSRLLRVTVRLNDQPGDRRTYRVLRWQVDSGS
jgi:general secretion pathway protein K